MLPTLTIGPLSLPTAPLLILFGIWLGTTLTENWLAKTAPGAITIKQINNLLLIALLTGFIAARLAYAARLPEAYLQNPLALLTLRPEALNASAGLLFGILAILIYRQKHNLPLGPLLDALTPFLAVMAIAIPLANFASGNSYGAITQMPWGINLWGAMRHPVQLYETAASIGFLIFIWPRPQIQFSPGQRFLWLVYLTAFSQVIFQTFHGDNQIIWGNVRSEQLIAWAALIIAFFLSRNFKTNKAASDAS